MITALYIALVFLLVFANGFFVASEFALVGVRRSRIEMLAADGSARATRLLRLLNNLNAGDEIVHPSGTFRVEKVEGKRIIRVRFIPSSHEEPSKTQSGAAATSLGLFMLLGEFAPLICL